MSELKIINKVAKLAHKLKKRGIKNSSCLALALWLSFPFALVNAEEIEKIEENGNSSQYVQVDGNIFKIPLTDNIYLIFRYTDEREKNYIIDEANEKLSEKNFDSKELIMDELDDSKLEKTSILETEDKEVDLATLSREEIWALDKDVVVNYILEKYNLTQFEFQVVLSVVYDEAAKNNYIDSYWTINTIYNRTISKEWVADTARSTKLDGQSLYATVISGNGRQFEVYRASHSGYDYETTKDSTAFYAVIDFLITGNRVHNCLSFRSNGSNHSGVRPSKGSNVYFGSLKESDLIDPSIGLEVNEHYLDDFSVDNLTKVKTK